MAGQNEANITCTECGYTIKTYHRFCNNCGAFINHPEDGIISIFNNNKLQSIFLFYFIYLFVCLSVKYTSWFYSYDHLFWVEIFLAVVTIYFAFTIRSSIRPLLRFNNFKWSRLAGIIVLSVIFSSVVNISINQINISIFRTNINLYNGYSFYHFPVVTMIYSIAIVPAVFEELAFRGVLYSYLNNFFDERLTVIMSGVLFAAIHLNFFSLIWLIPFGILLGTFRKKYNTLWYGIIFHFVFNVTACLFDLYRIGFFR